MTALVPKASVTVFFTIQMSPLQEVQPDTEPRAKHDLTRLVRRKMYDTTVSS